MPPDKILRYCLAHLDGTVLVNSWGERCVFYNPDGKLKRGVYVLTVKERDGGNDKSSRLDREGIYRVNLGLRRSTFSQLFGSLPKRPAKGGVIDMEYDFSAVNTLLPHPVYGWMGWICALNPDENRFEELKPLVWEAYEYAKEKYAGRKPPPGRT